MEDSQTLIITVNFRQNKCTLQFLESASRLEGFGRCHLLIVDNNSCDGSVDRLRQAISRFSNVELLASSNNRGYFGGAKWALDEYLGRHAAPDWVIVCNNDVVWTETSFLSSLLLRNPRTEGVLAPAVISRLTGFDANPMIAKRPSRARMLRYQLLLSSYHLAWFAQWLAPLVRKARKALQTAKPALGDERRTIYAPHGAIFVFSRGFFEAGGFIDDGAFLYAEELRVAEMCQHLGVPIIHDPGLRVWHEENQTVGRLLTRETYFHQKNGFRYVLNRYQTPCFEPVPAGSHVDTKKSDDGSHRSYISGFGGRVS